MVRIDHNNLSISFKSERELDFFVHCAKMGNEIINNPLVGLDRYPGGNQL